MIREHYPFHELDFITREDGIKYILLYFEQPSEATLDNIRSKVKPYLLPYFDEYFWIFLRDINFKENGVFYWIDKVFECCFILIMWDIKYYVYDIDKSEIIVARVRQFSNQLKLIEQAFSQSEDLGKFMTIFKKQLRNFEVDLNENIRGYKGALDVIYQKEKVARKESLSIPPVKGFTLNWAVKKPAPIRLYDYLLNARLVDSRTEPQQVVNAFSGKELKGKIVWTGDLAQLKYFLHKLFRCDMLIEKKTDFQKANKLFNIENVELVQIN